MATKRRRDQLENLLDWEREGDRLPETMELFNRKISPTLFLRELDDKCWELEVFVQGDDDRLSRQVVTMKHTTLIQLGLSILDGVAVANKRFLA